MLIDRLIGILLSKYNLKIITIPLQYLKISSPTDLLVSYLSLKLGMDKIIIGLIIAFIL
jgi:hypothetical protein